MSKNLSKLQFLVRGKIVSEDDLPKILGETKKIKRESVAKFKGFIVTGLSKEDIADYITNMPNKSKSEKSQQELEEIAFRKATAKRLHKPFNIPQAAQEFARMAEKEGFIRVKVSSPEEK